MEEEKKVTEKQPVSQESKKNNTTMVALVLVGLIAICALVYLFVLKPKYEGEKDNNSNQETAVLTNDEAITIAKEKLEAANTNNLISVDTCFDGNEPYSKEGYGSMFCYYDTLENFKKKFYSVFSTKLDYKDVLVEYQLPSGNAETNVKETLYDIIYGYGIKDDKVYTNSCGAGAGAYKRMDKFTVDNITTDTIKVNYVIIGYSIPEVPEESEEFEYDNATMTLVKESGEWKILKATIVGMCNAVYEIGK